jgi:Predicted pPIWI-associating nuclease
MTKPPQKLTKKFPEWFEDLPKKLNEAVENFSLPDTEDWTALAELSANTEFEYIEVDSNSAVVEGGQLIAPATVYVKLNYGPENDGVEFHDSYPARVFFSTNKNDKSVTVKKIGVDVSSFYE